MIRKVKNKRNSKILMGADGMKKQPDDLKISIGKNIKRLRYQKQIGKAELAEYIGVTPRTISRWESGKSYPAIECLPAMAVALAVSVDELLVAQICERNARRDNIYAVICYAEKFGYKPYIVDYLREAFAEFPEDMEIGLAVSKGLYAEMWEENPNEEDLLIAKDILEYIFSRLNDQDFRTECSKLYNAILKLWCDTCCNPKKRVGSQPVDNDKK